MIPSKFNIILLLQRDCRFIIPVYQRNYSWKEEHCQKLFDDLLNLIRRAWQPPHFLGSVYCRNLSIRQCIIIDGQQRLTTISLLMLAMARMIEEGRLQTDDPKLASQLLDQYLTCYNDKRKPKLRHNKDDADAFDRLLNGQDGSDDSKIMRNYHYFRKCLAEQSYKPEELFNGIYHMEIILNEHEEGDDTLQIFETLNSTGQPLSESDKARTYLFMENNDSEQQEFWYKNYWHPIEKDCTNADGKPALAPFLRDYLTAKMSIIPKQGEIRIALENYCTSCGGRLEVLRDLARYVGSYRILLQGGSTIPQLDDCIRRLNYLGTGVARPYLLEALEMHRGGQLTDEELLSIFKGVESFVVRRFVCGLPTNSLNKIFQVLHHNILRDGCAEHMAYTDRFGYYLTSRWSSGRFPDDEEFRKGLTNFICSKQRLKHTRYLLERFENALTREQHEICGNKTYSVEHIMPQTLNDEWKRDLGQDYQAIHDRWKHSLANVTLTAYNSQYSNSSFTRKRDMPHGFRDSGLRLNSYLARLEHWDEAALQERQRRLLEDALAIWPRPVSSYCPPRSPKESMSLADWDAAGCPGPMIEGKKPLRCILLGQELHTATWRNMLLAVVRALYARDPAVIMNMIHGDHRDDDNKSINFSDKEYNKNRSIPYDRIDEGVYLCLPSSSVDIMQTLRLLLLRYRIDLSELIVFLKPQNQTSADTNNAAALTQIAGIEIINRKELGAMIGTRAPATIARFIKRHGLKSMRIKGKAHYARAAVEAAQRAELGVFNAPTEQADKQNEA